MPNIAKMPTIEEVIRLRRMGETQQEFGEIMKAQGSFISSKANSLLNAMESKEEDGEGMEAEGMPEAVKLSIIAGLNGERGSTSITDVVKADEPSPSNPNWPGSYFERSKLTI